MFWRFSTFWVQLFLFLGLILYHLGEKYIKMSLVFDECRSDEDPDDETDEQDDGGPKAGASDASLTTEKKVGTV